MKISRIQIKKIKNLKIQILSDGTYLQDNPQESVQESTKNPKLKNKRTIKSLQNLMWQGICQEFKILKYLKKNLAKKIKASTFALPMKKGAKIKAKDL